MDGAEKEVKKRVENGGPKRVLNRLKVPKTKAFRRIARKRCPGETRKWGPKNPYKQAIKNPNRYSI
jgi:hypothetical protein